MNEGKKVTTEQGYKVEGVVIQCETGEYLNRNFGWVEHDRGTDAYVHPNEKIDEILEMCVNWTVKPTRMRAALYNPVGGGTIIYGLPIKISV